MKVQKREIYTPVCTNKFCAEEATTYTWAKPRSERHFNPHSANVEKMVSS